MSKQGSPVFQGRPKSFTMALHGSSTEQFINIGNSVITPKLNMPNQGDKTLFETIISNCNRLFVLLGMVNNFVLKNEKVRFKVTESY